MTTRRPARARLHLVGLGAALALALGCRPAPPPLRLRLSVGGFGNAREWVLEAGVLQGRRHRGFSGEGPSASRTLSRAELAQVQDTLDRLYPPGAPARAHTGSAFDAWTTLEAHGGGRDLEIQGTHEPELEELAEVLGRLVPLAER
jgi:hypothetical protein